MNNIFIKDLEIFANHGVLEEEKTLGQKFLISAKLSCDFSKAVAHDGVEYTANYAEICKDIEYSFKREVFNLIETAADITASYIIQKHNNIIRKINLTVKKPWAPIGGMPLDHVSVSVERSWHTAYIGLGSNIGDLFENLNSAIAELERITTSNMPYLILEKKSGYIQTAPVSHIEQPDYLNCVVKIKTTMNPKELMNFLLSTEARLGRVREEKWGPRIIDMDILAYDNLVTDDPHVILPHPLMHERMFVIEPFCEIAPMYVHPLLNKRIQDIKEDLK